MQERVQKSANNNDSADQLVADFLARGGAIKTCRPEPHNKWQQHRLVRGTRSMRGRSK